MNNPFDLLKLYKVAQLQDKILSEDLNDNIDFSILDLLEINNRQNNLSKQFLSELFILNFIMNLEIKLNKKKLMLLKM